MAEKSKHGFIILLDFYEPMQCLTDAQKGQVFDACFAYHLGKEPDLNDPIVKMAFSFIKPFFDRQSEAYTKKCEQNRANVLKRYVNNQEDTTASDSKQTDTNVYDGIQPNTNAYDGYQIKVKSKSKSEIKTLKEENTSYSCQNPDFDAPGDAENPQQAELVPQPQAMPCPQQKILAIYHEVLPELPRIVKLDDDLQKNVRSRWQDKRKEKGFATEEEGLAYFKAFFEYVSHNSWLMGRADGQKGWRSDYRWLMAPKNFKKVTNGQYRGWDE